MYMKSKAGVTMHVDEWKKELDKFWKIFDNSRNCATFGARLPKRPPDAWERYVKIVGLTEV